MASKFYTPGNERAASVGDLFSTIATRYDLINDLQSFGLHRCWKRRLVKLANVHPGDRALDVCCGTGDIAFLLAWCGAQVTGLDFSEPMLAVAEERKKVAGRRKKLVGAGTVHFLKGDATRIPFEDRTFDVVTVGYGLRNLTSWEAGLREMQRVAKPGGRLLILDFGKPQNALWRRVYFAYLRLFVPMLGRLFCGNADAYAYILESLRHYPAQQGVAAKMRELGLANVRAVNLLGGVMGINCSEKRQV